MNAYQLTAEDLRSFKSIYKRKFGIDLDDKEALSSRISLLNLMRLVLKPTITNDSVVVE